MYNRGFDQNSFMVWIEENFYLNPYAIQTVINIIDYAQTYQHVSKDQFAEFVATLLPEIKFEEVARFCSDEILTDNTLRMLGRK